MTDSQTEEIFKNPTAIFLNISQGRFASPYFDQLIALCLNQAVKEGISDEQLSKGIKNLTELLNFRNIK